jgi:hypothetical protein
MDEQGHLLALTMTLLDSRNRVFKLAAKLGSLWWVWRCLLSFIENSPLTDGSIIRS